MTDPELVRLLTAAHEATRDIAHNVDVAQLFDDGARAAERMPEPLGAAVAGVLALAAYERRLTAHHRQDSLGASKTTMALALAALAWTPGERTEG